MEYETAYLLRRAEQEKAAADAARHPCAKEAHMTMARLYEERIANRCLGTPSRSRESRDV